MTENYMKIDSESASIQTHLSIIQNVIQRMSANSSSCKAWCVSLVSAVLVIVAGKGNAEFAWIALFPSLVFAALDAYYLALEKAFRNSYNSFIAKIHKKQLKEQDLYSVLPVGNINKLQFEAFMSFSVWGFYLSLIILIAVIKWLALS